MGLRTWLGLRKREPTRRPQQIPPRPLKGPSPLKPIFEELAARQFTLVQIGAYVGTSENDPVSPFLKSALPLGLGSRAVLVEPVREYFEALQANYAEVSGISFENVAIAETEGEREFFRVAGDPAEKGFPVWFQQLSSLRSDRMTNIWPQYEGKWISKDLLNLYMKHRISEKVPCITFNQLLAKHRISEVDFLQIDTEGYDYEILKTIDFKKIRPKYINYERVLLLDDERPCRRMMRAHGYSLTDWELDTLCVRND